METIKANDFRIDLGKRLRGLRLAKGLKQDELAEKISIARGSIGNYETGARTPDAEILLKFADFFDVSADYLLGIREDQKEREFDKRLSSLEKEIAELKGQVSVRHEADIDELIKNITAKINRSTQQL
ncbi:HTH-type transcriptional regulator ImmR [Desulfosporosinus acididurans]|uniref:HTH-type transcriptional regulator ImmR n=1 Tax=Desulfosporosinus acididurans TaxID=476652 RepID=A0A0J1IPU2_9FIRM|nr:helix-turn-helix transcriptional regulator [Desulfosporosinus acididurans]KLU66716.1 HTH-type transcriptional regulator ImmR [Desulfosporosinus acididurans]